MSGLNVSSSLDQTPLVMERDKPPGDGSAVGNAKMGSVPWVACCTSILAFPLDLLSGWVVVNPTEVVAVEHCGVVTSIHEEPGCFKVPCAGKTERRVSTKRIARELPSTKVVDAVGAPVIVSGIINFRVVEPLKAIYDTESFQQFVTVNAHAMLKQVVASHSYNELKAHADQINAHLKAALEPKTLPAGVEILSFSLSELNYAPEIAAAMLKKQQAGALIEARSLIVEGAVRIAQEAIGQLSKDGQTKLSDADKTKIITNLLTVTCSDRDATPTVAV